MSGRTETSNKSIRGVVQALLLLALALSCSSACFASRGGSPGQDILLAPNGIDTKESSADAMKQEANQKGGGQKGGGGGGGGGQGGGGGGGLYPYNDFTRSKSFPGGMGPSTSVNYDVEAAERAYCFNIAPQNTMSGSGESGQSTDSNQSTYQSGSNVYGGYGGANYPDYSNGTGIPNVRTPLHPEHAAAPTGHPRDAVQAGLPPCCKDKLPCCTSNWPCCQKAEYHGYTPPGSPSNLPYSQNMQGKDNVLQKGQTNQNQQGQNNNNNNNSNQQSQSQSTTQTPAQTEGGNGPGNTISGTAAQIGATNQMMNGTGMSSASGGKHLSGAAAAVTSALNMFNMVRSGQMPGTNKEQGKSDQAFEKSVVADNLAEMERTQSATAISFILGFLQNFTSGGNQYVALHDQVFVPIAVLLLLPGAVMAQMRAIVAQGFSVLGEVNPWDGILRSIVAIFLIMSSGLVMNYTLDVANALIQTVSTGYNQNFGSNMGSDAAAMHVRAHPIRLPQENYTVIPNIETVMFNYFGDTPAASMEGQLLAVKYEDPRAGLYIVPPDRAPETVPFKVPFAREAFNEINCGLAFGWVILCAMQVVYLYYLYFMGPVIAALWVYPSQILRQAFPNWIEGVVSLCFWSMFWATTVCIMACFRGVDDTGTVACTACLALALLSAKSAFDFVGLVKEAAREAEKVAEKVGKALLEARAAKAKGGGPGPGPGPGPG